MAKQRSACPSDDKPGGIPVSLCTADRALADSHMAIDNRDGAVSTLDKTVKQKKRQKSAESVTDDLEDRSKADKRRKR
ncbi:MAG: hypothetical protein K1565_04250 [Candidatus Thiodiazotropha sp. (ex. Lucinisca nassula)]|nr:hypothetical protein [Candidatus Thiodiazotropha sp. (ex. Lucinisca nassula)]PUB84215.1 MAG: hypothetical protein DBP02_09565 [gamma proteobacterium symbiont of Ctena orbiculata]PUB89014.1 MAG: hypothetical protein DBP01_11110 [gamma proteobacterium symbiont of Ctena orbiculata]